VSDVPEEGAVTAGAAAHDAMTTTKRAALAAAVGVVVLGVLEATAAAEPTKKDDQYGYVFQDDVLKGDTLGAGGPQITVLKMGRRDRLLRPRMHFVSEMLKSVENL
jgi:hypothetical protein